MSSVGMTPAHDALKVEALRRCLLELLTAARLDDENSIYTVPIHQILNAHEVMRVTAPKGIKV